MLLSLVSKQIFVLDILRYSVFTTIGKRFTQKYDS